MAKRVRLPKAERESFWRSQISDWAQGGQTISGFCRERGLTESAFHFWKRQLGLGLPPAMYQPSLENLWWCGWLAGVRA